VLAAAQHDPAPALTQPAPVKITSPVLDHAPETIPMSAFYNFAPAHFESPVSVQSPVSLPAVEAFLTDTISNGGTFIFTGNGMNIKMIDANPAHQPSPGRTSLKSWTGRGYGSETFKFSDGSTLTIVGILSHPVHHAVWQVGAQGVRGHCFLVGIGPGAALCRSGKEWDDADSWSPSRNRT
jgi:hypothetical protein